MESITININDKAGKIKPMHAVNNGPVYKFKSDQRITNLDAFKEAGIPYARNHDASFYATYGGEHIVDVNFIFPNFDADPDDPSSYDFVLTDEYIRVMELANVECFYRLGSKIEHWKKKYNTLPPKDFHKWAVICEHIIRHYNYGWADGFNLNIKYWEIWNEPDLDGDDSTNKRTWGGVAKEFYELFNITANHLKKCFPELKIGGPACAGLKDEWLKGFFENLTAPIDFFSWHVYACNTESFKCAAEKARKLLDSYGLFHVESILNEWNYVRGWVDDAWVYSLKQEKLLKGSSFIASVMCDSQYSSIDMLMYYDARPSAMNGLFNTDNVSEVLKGYYPFKMFNELYKIGDAVAVESDCEDIHVAAANGKDGFAAMVSYFNDDDASPEKEVKVNIKNFDVGEGVRLGFYLLDENNDMTLVKEELFSSSEFSVYLKMSLYSTYIIKALPL